LATTCSCVIISPRYQHIWLILGRSLFVKIFKSCEAKSRYTSARGTQPGQLGLACIKRSPKQLESSDIESCVGSARSWSLSWVWHIFELWLKKIVVWYFGPQLRRQWPWLYNGLLCCWWHISTMVNIHNDHLKASQPNGSWICEGTRGGLERYWDSFRRFIS
jgi:hypothetical protein